MLVKAMVTVAGLDTRLLSVTKDMPKEMLPLFTISPKGSTSLKLIIQIIF